MSLTTDDKANFYDIQELFLKEHFAAEFQLFRVTEEGKWYPAVAYQCAPDVDNEDDDYKYMAIIDGIAYPVTVQIGRVERAYYDPGYDNHDGENDDHSTLTTYFLYANNVKVGESQGINP